ncbi:hypothetical protein GCM10020218_028020 [Dactylosporangium vinaceum]
MALTSADGLRRSRMLHQLRVLAIPGFVRRRGPATGIDPVLDEQWTVTDHEHRLPALIEAGAYGATLEQAAAAHIAERIAAAGGKVGVLAGALFDAALCGTGRLSDRVLQDLRLGIAAAQELGELGHLLGGTAGAVAARPAPRHRRVRGPRRGDRRRARPGALARRGRAGCRAAGRPGPHRRDRRAARHGPARRGPASTGRRPAATMARVAAAAEAPPDLRGAAFGFGLGPRRARRSAARGPGAGGPVALGDWLAGVFGVAREEVLHADGVLDLLDEIVSGLGPDDFLIALPALRQAFAYFPPRERETIAGHVLQRRGHRGSGRALLRRPAADPQVLARAAALEARVDSALARQGLLR